MMQVGIFTAYFPHELEETAKRIRANGFNTVALDLHFKDMDLGPGQITSQKAKKVRDTFRSYDLPICVISGYQNIVHPDLDERKKRIENLKEIIRWSHELGSPMVASETGTFNPDSDWVHHPKNRTEEGFEIARDIIGEIAQVAQENGSKFLIETYINNVISTTAETERVLREVNNPALELVMDPTNYFDGINIDDMDGVINDIFDTVPNKFRIAHAKDVKRSKDSTEKHASIGDDSASEAHTYRGVGDIELPAPGHGDLNYALYLKRLSELDPDIPLIVEHLDEDDVPRAKKYVVDHLMALGL